MPAAQLATSY